MTLRKASIRAVNVSLKGFVGLCLIDAHKGLIRANNTVFSLNFDNPNYSFFSFLCNLCKRQAFLIAATTATTAIITGNVTQKNAAAPLESPHLLNNTEMTSAITERSA